MKTPEVTVVGTVTAVTAGTSLTVTPGVDTYDRAGVGTIATVVVNGTGLQSLAGVGDRVRIRLTTG